MKKVYVNVTVRLIVELQEGETIDNLIQEMDYNFKESEDTRAKIIDTEIIDFEIHK